jgi:hypothetical protein
MKGNGKARSRGIGTPPWSEIHPAARIGTAMGKK